MSKVMTKKELVQALYSAGRTIPEIAHVLKLSEDMVDHALGKPISDHRLLEDVAAELKRLREENAKLRETLQQIHDLAEKRLAEGQLPKRVDAMTQDEYAVFEAMAIFSGACASVRDWAADTLREVDATTAATGE